MSDRPSGRERGETLHETWEPQGSGEIAVPAARPGHRPSGAAPTRDSGEVLVPSSEVATRLAVTTIARLSEAASRATTVDELRAEATRIVGEDPSGVAHEVVEAALPALLQGVQVRAELEHFRRSSALLVSRASVPIAVMDLEGRLDVTSTPLARALGKLDRPRVRLVDLVDDADRPALERALVDARTSSTPVGPVVVHVDQGTRTLSLELGALRKVDGDVSHVVALGRDVSEVAKLEQQVRHSDRLATVGRIAAGVVHELNNPLSSIFVYAESLLRHAVREGAPADQQQKLRRIVDNAERIQRLTQDLTAYSRPHLGTSEVMPIESVVDQSLGFCEHVLRDAGVEVERRYAPEPSPVVGVRTQLQQVFINLITNACHAMAGGIARLGIETHRTSRGEVVVRIVDSGPGIPEEMRESVFEPFVTTKREGEGTGLGLSIVRKLVEQHGGTVIIEEGDAPGATFVVTLPIARTESTGAVRG